MKEIKGRAAGWMARAVAILALAAPLSAGAQAITAIWSSPASGNTQLRQSPESSITLSADRGHIALAMRSMSPASSTVSSSITFDAPQQQPIVVGMYENLRSYYPSLRQGAVAYSATGESCYGYDGSRATVLEVVYDGSTLVRFAADFELKCDYYGTTPTFVEVRINSTVPLMMNRPAGWTTPDPVAFANRTFVQPGSSVVSQAVTIWGINAAAPISVAGGEYSVNDGPFTSTAGTVNAKDRVRLLLTAASTNSSTTARLTVGGMSASFTAFSETTGVPITVLRAEGSPGDSMLSGGSINVPSPDWKFDVGSSSRQSASLTATSPGGDSYSLALSAPVGQSLAVGAYEQAGGSASSVRGYLAFSSRNRSCTNDGGRFVILDIGFDASGVVTRLAVDFEQRCSATNIQYGEVRYNSDIPFTFQEGPLSSSPDPFTFAAVAEALPGQVRESNLVSVIGINAPASIQVSGGEYSVNGGAYTGSPGTVSNRDRVRVRTVAPSTGGATATATLTIADRSASFVVRSYAVGDTLTALHVEGDTTFDAMAPNVGIAPSQSYGGQQTVSLYLTTAAGNTLGNLVFQAPYGAALAVGAYEIPYPNAAGSPYLVLGSFSACYAPTGRFVVHEIAWSPSGTLDRFAADFTGWCGNGVVHGEVRYRSTATMVQFKPAGSTLPNAFTFLPKGPVTGGSRVLSNRISIYGVNAPVALSISGGEYSLNGAAFTSLAGNASNGDSIVVRAVAPYAAGATQVATLNVGGRMGAFSVRTYAPGEPIDALVYTSDSGDYIGQGRSGSFVGDAIRLTPSTYYASTSYVLLSASFAGESWDIEIAAPSGTSLVPGVYANAQRYPFQDAGRPGLDISGSGRGCNTLTGRFVLHEIEFANGRVAKLALDFEQHCEGASPALRGELRYRSSVPISTLRPTNPIRYRGLDANADGHADILWMHSDGRSALWLMDGPYQVGGGGLLGAGSGWTITHIGDFNGDGRSDILWRHADGRVALWLMNGGTQVGGALLMSANTGWTVVAVADFNGDGKSDILFRHPDGRVAMWIMDGSQQVGGALMLTAGNPWVPKLTGDLNGDGRADILYEHPDGRAAAWLMNGTQQIGGATLISAGANWSARLLTDVNGDGKADIVWWNTDGKSAVWLMDGTSQSGGALLMNAGSPYVPVLAADIDGDGKGDIVWRASDGTTIFWTMDGAVQRGGGQILAPGSGWTVTRVADFSGDGIGDALLVHTDGRVRMDLFDGLNYSSSAMLFNGGSGWTPVTTP